MRDMREQSDEKARQIEEKEDAELNTDKEMNYVSVDGQMIHWNWNGNRNGNGKWNSNWNELVSNLSDSTSWYSNKPTLYG